MLSNQTRFQSTQTRNALLLALAATIAGCSKSNAPDGSSIPTLNGGGDPTSIGPGQGAVITGPNGSNILVQNRNGEYYFEAEATLSPTVFERLHTAGASAYSDAIASTTKALKDAGAIPLSVRPEVGYFDFFLPYHRDDLLSALKSAHFGAAGVYVSPVHYDLNSLQAVKDRTASAAGFTANLDPRANDDAFSGLNRIGAVAFAQLAQQAIGAGAVVDGSSTKVGITDTGITYNHPTFLAKDLTTNRIQYMRDFTREGRAYFNPAAKFEAVAAAADSGFDFVITAQVIDGVVTPALPAGDQFRDVTALNIKASPELKAALAADPSKFRLAYIDEATLQGKEGDVDLNANGKLDDKFPILLQIGASPTDDVVYADFSGTGNFSSAKPIHHFNSSRETMAVFAEKIGFDIRKDQLPPKTGTDLVDVRSVSFVGFDAGNHGTHVAGIAAGRKTIANDPDDTLARGVAPNAQIFSDRVCANNGGCNATSAMIDLATQAGVQVINMSLGGLSPFNDGYGVQETVLNRLTSVNNVLFVVSAGNEGPGRQTIGSPSTARLSLSVGASSSKAQIQRQYQMPGNGGSTVSQPTDDSSDEFMLFFSSRGPTANGAFKPNISAPGTELSSIPLNTAPGSRAGMDIYWGTSMAAPTVTGAFALFLDGIHKYNDAHPDAPLSTDAVTLRSILIASAKPFDMGSFDPTTGQVTHGQYSWVDEGAGLINLPAAWAKLVELRDHSLPSGVVDSQGKNVDLDYSILVNLKSPTGVLYDGSRAWQDDAGNKAPAFGAGLYLDYYSGEVLRSVQVQRHLPEKYTSSPDLGLLTRNLTTTAEEFVLKTTYYGQSQQAWLKAGTLGQVNCMDSPTSNLRILGRGAEVTTTDAGTGTINETPASYLYVCLDRNAIQTQLAAGDHGAIISAFRKVGNDVATIPAFVVPVYITIPHQTLANSTAYKVDGQVGSFGVNHNYVTIPKGATLVKVTLSVPAYSRDTGCSSVELMDLEGGNTIKATEADGTNLVANCKTNGTPITDPAKLSISFTRVKPVAGIWDLNVFGEYRFPSSKYTIQVDYLVASTSVASVKGDASVLNGSFDYLVQDASLAVTPDLSKSSYKFGSLINSVQTNVAQDQDLIVASKLGRLRSYPAGVQSVTLKTGGSPGNDIDIQVIECASADVANPNQDAGCTVVAESGGPDDNESASFRPAAGKFYTLNVHGYDVKDAGGFTATEILNLAPEAGTLAIAATSGTSSKVTYSFDPTNSALFANPLYTGGLCDIGGAITLRSTDGLVLANVPVQIQAPAAH